MFMKLATALIVIIVAGCAHQPSPYAMYADCTLPVTRNAGMGVAVPGCAMWHFGPSREQAYRFKHNLPAGALR